LCVKLELNQGYTTMHGHQKKKGVLLIQVILDSSAIEFPPLIISVRYKFAVTMWYGDSSPNTSQFVVQNVQLKSGPYFNMSNLFTKIYNMLYYTTKLYLQ
jgi:hypothetical protein